MVVMKEEVIVMLLEEIGKSQHSCCGLGVI